MNRIRCIAALLLVFIMTLGLLGCSTTSTETKTEGTPIQVYYKSNDDNALVSSVRYIKSVNTDAQISELLEYIVTQPQISGCKSSVPADVQIVSHYFGEDGQLIVDFNSAYLMMDTIQEILCRASIVRTLCGISEVKFVEFTVEGQSLMLQGEQPAGQMTASDFIDNTGSFTELTQTSYAIIYFTDSEGQLLHGIRIQVESSGQKSTEQLVVEQLVAGPKSISGAIHAYPTIPSGTTVNKVTTKDGVCYVDLSGELLEPREGVTAECTVYSIVNTLCELTSVKKVQISVDGKTDAKLGDISLSGFFERKLELIVE